MDKNITTTEATTDVLYDQWASNLLQILGVQGYRGHYRTLSPQKCKAFLKAFVASDHERQLRFASQMYVDQNGEVKMQNKDWLRCAIRGWSEPNISIAELRERICSSKNGDGEDCLLFKYDEQVLVVKLERNKNDFGYKCIVEVGPGDKDLIMAHFSHPVTANGISDFTEEWAHTICSVIQLLQEAGYNHF